MSNTRHPNNQAPPLATDNCNQLASTQYGYLLYNQHDIYIGRSLSQLGEYNGQEMLRLESLCLPGSCVIEAGANIGSHTVGLAKRVGPSGTVLAFEPQRLVFQTLCANVALNSLSNVYCYWAALGNTHSTIHIPTLDPETAHNFGGAAINPALGKGDQVPQLMLDDYLYLPTVRLLKIDVEGMEQQVLEGAHQLLARDQPLIYLENDRTQSSRQLITLLDALGYDMYWDLPPLYRPNNHYHNPNNIFGNVVSVNMLCVHRDNPLIKVNGAKITDFGHHPMRRRTPLKRAETKA